VGHRKLQNAGLHNLVYSPSEMIRTFNSRRIRWAVQRTTWGDEKCMEMVGRKTTKMGILVLTRYTLEII
jgi:hypothetical protein